MADIGTNLKNIWMKGMEAIGNTASSIASNTRFKVDEMNLVNRRSEILKDFGLKAYTLWQKGAHFPEELEDQLRELGKLDEQLNDLRTERFAGVSSRESDAPEAVLKEADGEAVPGSGEAEDAIFGTGDSTMDAIPQNAEASPDGDEAQAAAIAPKETEHPLPAAAEGTPEEAGAETGSDPAENPVPQAAENEPEETFVRQEEKADNGVPVIRVEIPKETDPQKSPLSSAIDDLFDSAPSAEEIGGKMSSAVDDLFGQASSVKEAAEDAVEKTAERANDTISELAGKIPSAEEAAGKVNDALDSLGSEMKKFSDALDSKIQALTRKIKGED